MKQCCIDFGIILGACLEVFFWYFSNFAKNATPHENAVNSSQIVGRAAMETKKFDAKSDKKIDRKPHRNFDDFLKVVGVILGGFLEHFGFQKPFQIRS